MSPSELTPAAINALRERLGLTQEQFADRIGCTSQAVSFWERGTRTPRGLYARAVRGLMAASDGDLMTPPAHRPDQ